MCEATDHEAMPIARTPAIDPRTHRALIAASVFGGIHAAFSLYWAAGGEVLAWSLGTDLLGRFRGRGWLLAPIGTIKLAAALAPLMLARTGWPLRRLTRSACWAGAIVLVGWGAALAMGLIASRKRSTKAGATLTSRQAGH